MPNDTTVITVGHNSEGVIKGLLDSLPYHASTIVVDNASTDSTSNVANDAAPEAKILRLTRNEGFGRACNFGAEFAETTYLFFVNPDARLAPGTINALENAADRLPNFVAGNPLMLSCKGNARIKTTSILPLKKIPRPQLTKDSELAVLSGAAFFVKKQDFHAVGGFDPGIFLYHEDHDLSTRLVSEGGKLWHVAGASALHVAGAGSTRSTKIAFFKGYHMARSRHYVLKKYNQPAAMLRTIGPAIFGLLLPHNLLSARRRAKHKGQIKGAFSSFNDNGKCSLS